MKREERIIQEAKKYYSDNIRCYNAFLHGVEFAEEYPENVWHDASEYPIEAGAILYRTTLGSSELVVHGARSEYVWKVFVKDYGVKEWAYINDLLPKKEINYDTKENLSKRD